MMAVEVVPKGTSRLMLVGQLVTTGSTLSELQGGRKKIKLLHQSDHQIESKQTNNFAIWGNSNLFRSVCSPSGVGLVGVTKVLHGIHFVLALVGDNMRNAPYDRRSFDFHLSP